MQDLDSINSSKVLKNEVTYFNQENSQSHGENVNIIIVTRKRLKNHKKHNVFIQAQQHRVFARSSKFSRSKKQVSVTRHSSMPELNECIWPKPSRNRSGRGKDTIQNKNKLSPFRSKFIVNVVSEHRFEERLNPFSYPRQTKLKVYRCDVGGQDNCCCTCNSDAMFEIMRSLYECYKKRDCTDCKCILCSHLKPEDKTKFSEKEKLLRETAMKGLPLPEGTTPSEKKLIIKVRTDLGVPVEPKTKEIRDKHEEASKAGKLLPLEGKKPAEKEKILKDLFDMGIPLPKGRTPSEKALIAKITGKEPSEEVSLAMAHSELMRKAIAEGLLTPLKGKTPENKEKILKGLAMLGLPLPEGQTPSENKLIEKVRTDLGVPIEPTSKDIRDKHEKAAKAGKLLPLEGKTPEQKEKILKGLHNMGIPLPVGRTPSEKSLIARIAAGPREPSKASSAARKHSEIMRKAIAEGLLTPLKGKTPKQREKILRGLAMKGLPLPEGQSPSEKKLIKKVRTDLGVPIEPTSKAIRKKHEEASKAGKLLPLEGKKPEKKKKILQDLHNMEIPLPIGRTPSEKALIAEVKSKKPSKSVSVTLAPSEKMRRAKEEGLLTPLKGKTPEQKEKIVKGLAMKGLPLPEAQSASEKKLIDKVRADLGLPKDPTTKSMKDRHEQAAKVGLLKPLEGKTPEQKEKILKGLRDLGIPLPEGRTPSEKALIEKVKASPPSIIAPSEQMRRAKVEGLLTPIKGKSPEQKEKIVKGLAMKGLPLPEAQSPSEQKLIDKVRADLGLPKDPTTKSMKDRHERAAKAGLLQPLEGKTPAQKEKVLKGLRDLGIPLPEGRTPSEKALIDKVKASPRSIIAPSEQLRRAKAEGLLTPLKGKSPEQKEKILTGLAMKGLPLPEAQSPSEQKLIDKVRADLGLPKDPATKSMKEKHEQAAKAGLLQPLEGKTPEEKAKVLKGLRDLGIPLPEGRTPSEKALIGKIKESPRSVISPSEQLRRAKAEGLLTTLKGKTPEQKEKILKGLAMKGLPLPEAQSPSEKILTDKVRADLGLPKDPTTKSMKVRHEQAAKAGLLQPLEGKTPAEKAKVLKGLRDLGIPLPEGRTPSEKALIGKIKESPRSVISPSEQLRRAKAEGLLTTLKGKSPEQKEKILKGLAMKGLALPEAQSPSEKKLIDKVRADLGLPKDPTTKSMKDRHEQAAKAGLLQPLEGKTPAEKAKVLKGLRDLGIPLPEGRTPSEKALIGKIKESPRSVISPSEQLRRAKAEGLLTTLKGKTPEQKEKILKGLAMKGLPLPEAQTPSEKKLTDKVRADLGLPKDPTTKSMKDKHEQAVKAGFLQPLEGKTPAEKAKVLKGLRDLGIPLPEGRTPSEKALIAKVKAASQSVVALSERLRKAKAEGLLTALKSKTPDEREKILKGLAMQGLPLPEGQSPSENQLINKVRTDLGLPIEPKTKDIRDKHEKAAKAGKLLPLEGKTPAQKEKILKGLHNMGIPLPVGRTPSEKSLIAKIAASPREPSISSSVARARSEQMRKAKAQGLLTPLKGKSPEDKEKILRGLAMVGLPLPQAESPSESKLIKKVRAELGLPIEPKNKDIRAKHEKAAKAGKLLPLEGKTPEEKAKILKGLHNMGIPLPVGRTPSEKSLIAKIAASPREPSKAPSVALAHSEQMRRAEAEGLLTPLADKSPEYKEKILRGLAMKGLPLPAAQSPSENKLIKKVRADLGLPIEPKNKDIRHKHEKAAKAGKLLPLEGKSPEQKEKILKGLHNMGIPLPVGRTPSEKSLIAKIAASPREASIASSAARAHSELMRKAKAEGLLTPLADKTPDEKEKILRGLAMKGLPLPEGKSPSEKELIDYVRNDLGLPIEPKNKSIRDKHEKAAKAGKLLALEGKTPEEKENILKGLHNMGIPLPVGRTPSEKSLIAKIAASPREASITSSVIRAHSELMRKAKAEGLLTPLADKTPDDKEKILRGLAMKGLPLPEGKSPSEKELIDYVRNELGLPIEPKTKDIRDKHNQAAKAGKLLPLEGKTPEEKEKILKGLHNMGIPLPVGRTPSEKSLIAKIAASPRGPSKAVSSISKKLRAAKAEGLLTPLKDKTPDEREKILRGLAMKGLPLPEGQSPSENQIIDKVRTDLGLPIEPKTKDIRDKHDQAAKAGKLWPLEGKTPQEKENILQDLHNMGIPLPIGRTASEKALIAKVMAGPGKSIAEEYEEIQKTTKCDRGCGCDKKRIRFKHSYVKIRVTSPDISSFCDCPDICIPGVKSGVFIDSDGIKVTVASALGTPSFTGRYNHSITLDDFSSRTSYSYTKHKGFKNSKNPKYKVSSIESSLGSNRLRYILSSSSYFESSSTRPNSTDSENIYLRSSTPLLHRNLEGPVKRCLRGGSRNPTSKTKSTASSLSSILVLKSEMSICSTISNKIKKIVSLTSVMNSSFTSTSTHYSSYQSTDDPRRSSSLDDLITSDDSIDYPATIGERNKLWNIGAAFSKREYTIFRVSETRLDFVNSEVRMNVNSKEDPIVLIDHLPSKLNVPNIMNKIMSRKRFADASSIFIVVPMSEDEEEQASFSGIDSMTSIHSSGTEIILREANQVDPNLALKPHLFTERDKLIRKGRKFYLKEIFSIDTKTMVDKECMQAPRPMELMNDDFRQNSRPNERAAEKLAKAVHAIVRLTDTSTDIPSFCSPKECPNAFVVHKCSHKELYTANTLTRQKKYLSLQDRGTSYSHIPDMRTPSSMSSVMPCVKPDVLGSNLSPDIKSGGCRLPDMRTPSPTSLVQLLGSSSALKSRILPTNTRGCLPDMRTPSAGSSDLPCGAPAHPSVGPSHFPHKSTGYYRLPAMSIAIATSSILQCDVPRSSSSDWSRRSLSETFGYCFPPASNEAAKILSNIRDSCSDSHLTLDDFQRIPSRPGHNMHYSRIETTSPERNHRDNRSTDRISSRKPQLQELRYSELPLYSSDGDDCLCEEIEGTDKMLGQESQLQDSAKSKIQLNHADGDIEDPNIITDEIPNNQHRLQTTRKSKISKYSTVEENGLFEDIEGRKTITGKISSLKRRPQASWKSKTPMGPAYEEFSKFEEANGTHMRTDGISSRVPRLQEQRNSELPLYSSDGDDCLCEEIEGTDKMLGQEPQLQDNAKSMIPLNHADGDIEKPNIITDEIPNNQHRLQTTRQSKISKYSTVEENGLFEDKEGRETITGKISSLKRRPQASWKSKTPMGPAYEEFSKFEEANGTHMRTDGISSRVPRLQEQRNSELPLYSSDGDDCLCEEIEGTDKMLGQEPQLQDNAKSKMPLNHADGDHFLNADREDSNIITDEIPNNEPQKSRKSKISKYSTVEENCLCEDVDGIETITGKIPSLRSPLGRPQASWKSKMQMPMGSAYEEFSKFEEVKGTDIRTDRISSRVPRLQEQRNSELPLYSSDDGYDCLCEEIEGTDNILSQEPQLQDSTKSKMPLNHADGDDCLCEDVDGANKRSTQQLGFETSQKSKKLKESAIKESFENIGVQRQDTPHKLRNRHSRPPVNWKAIEVKNSTKNLTTKDYEFGQQLKSPVIKMNCECLHQSKDFANKANCECQQHSKASAIKENSKYHQQSKMFAYKELCACEQITARNRLCITSQGQRQERASTNSSKINKLMSSIRKPISHTIDQTSKDESKKNVEAEKQSVKPQSKRSNELCACEEIIARNKLCFTGQGQREKVRTNSNKINKLMSSIRKSISRTIDKSRKSKYKKDVEAEKISVKPQINHGIQTTPEHEQVLQTQQIGPSAPSDPEFINDRYPHEYSCGWIDIKELMRLRSELTEITSGFKACKKRYQKDTILEPNAGTELDFEDAIKYYIGKNLDQFKDLILPIESIQKTTQEANKNTEKRGNDYAEEYKNIDNYLDCCKCPYGPVPLEISYKSTTLTPEASAELAKLYPKGLKFSLGGTGLKPECACEPRDQPIKPAPDGPGASGKLDRNTEGT